MTRIHFVRHGTHDLLGKVLAGRMPGVHLGAEGQRQAKDLADHFAGQPIAAVLSSPVMRCIETATPIAERLGLAAVESDALIEIDCGAWTGKRFDELHDDPQWTTWNVDRAQGGPPGGETARAVQARIVAAMQALAASDRGPTILVTHSDIIKVAVATLLGAPLDWHDRFVIDPASVTTADLWAGGGKVLHVNRPIGS